MIRLAILRCDLALSLLARKLKRKLVYRPAALRGAKR